MKMPMFIWIPRILVMLFALFTVVISFDAFGGAGSLWSKLGAFIVHNIFFFILSFILIATWSKPLIAGVLFIVFAIAIVIVFHARWSGISYLLIGAPPLVVGLLFIAAHFMIKRTMRETTPI